MYGIDYCYYAGPNEKETNLYFINATLFLYLLSALNVIAIKAKTLQVHDVSLQNTFIYSFALPTHIGGNIITAWNTFNGKVTN